MKQRRVTKTLMCFVCLAGWLAAGGLAGSAWLRAADISKRAGGPNIVVILADDLGYGDVQCYNPERGKIPTPNIDRLASEGMRFTDGHSSSGVCSPSRYALLTGRYHWRTRLQTGIVGVFGDPLIAPDRLTIAGLAKQHGYQTACIGKWHLGRDWGVPADKGDMFQVAKNVTVATDEHRAAWQEVFSKPMAGGPTVRGFDEYFGTDVPNWPPYCFIENDRTVGIPSELLPARLFQNHQASLQGPAQGLEIRADPAGAGRSGLPLHRPSGTGKGGVPALHAVDFAAHAAGRQRRLEGQERTGPGLPRLRHGDRLGRGPRARRHPHKRRRR